jgi:hypothetical protein
VPKPLAASTGPSPRKRKRTAPAPAAAAFSALAGSDADDEEEDDAVAASASLMARTRRTSTTPTSAKKRKASASAAAAASSRPADYLSRILRSNARNANKKAEPTNDRTIFNLQKQFSYGFVSHMSAAVKARAAGLPADEQTGENNPAHTHMNYADTGAYYRKGQGGQPYLTLNKSIYGTLIDSDYDTLISKFAAGTDKAVASKILGNIRHGTALGITTEGQAMAALVYLTQVIEPHQTRVPGVDKLARAQLRAIEAGKRTFADVFNRFDGEFFVAWNKKNGKAPAGGQVAARALLGKSKPGENYTVPETLKKRLKETVDGYMSASSGGEASDDE